MTARCPDPGAAPQTTAVHDRLVDLVRPRTSLGVPFPDVQVAALRAWMVGRVGPALATAGPGSGLTTLVELLAAENDLELLRVGSGTPQVKAFLDSAGSSAVTVEMRRKVILVEGADALATTESVAWTDVLAFVRSGPRVPVLLAAHSRRSTKPFEFARTWPRFDLGKPSAPVVRAILHTALRAALSRGPTGVIPESLLDALARDVRGDVRAAINALDLACRGSQTDAASSAATADAAATAAAAAADAEDAEVARTARTARTATHAPGVAAKDVREDGLDVVEAVLTGARGISPDEAARMHEPSMVAMGMFENYHAVTRDLDTLADVADWFSVSDVVDARSHGAADPPFGDRALYRVVALAGPARALGASKGTCAVKKFGSVWSKQFNACTKSNQVKALAAARGGRGMAALEPGDLAFVRSGVRRCLARGDDAALRSLVEGWSVQDVLALVRMEPGAPGVTAAVRERLKRACE